jgi:hypothetical protein
VCFTFKSTTEIKIHVSQLVSRLMGLESTGLHSSFSTVTKLEEWESSDTSRIPTTRAAHRTRIIIAEVATRWPPITISYTPQTTTMSNQHPVAPLSCSVPALNALDQFSTKLSYISDKQSFSDEVRNKSISTLFLTSLSTEREISCYQFLAAFSAK